MDLVIPRGEERLWLIEAKASATPAPEMATPMLRLAQAVKGRDAVKLVVHRPGRSGPAISTLRAGVRALSLPELVTLFREELRPRTRTRR